MCYCNQHSNDKGGKNRRQSLMNSQTSYGVTRAVYIASNLKKRLCYAINKQKKSRFY